MVEKINYIKTLYKDVEKDFETSLYGYYIKPNGDLLSLTRFQSHGLVAVNEEPKILEMYDPNSEGGKPETTWDVLATTKLNWIRISVTPYVYGLNVDWGNFYTKEQLKILETVLDFINPDEEDNQIWFTGGPGNSKSLLKAMKEQCDED